jgi:holliday junction DNA helicase RuvA
MIGSLKGIVGALGEDAALIEVGGVGYLVQASARTLGRMALGQGVHLMIETQVREDAIRLFGFLSEEERGCFVQLQTVQGVGAKVALAILDTLGADGVADALVLQDKTAFARASGVGPKLAARIAQELAGKAAPRGFLPMSAPGGAPARAVAAGADSAGPARAEAVSALVNLGIDGQTAGRAVALAAKALGPDANISEIIRAALKEAGKGG